MRSLAGSLADGVLVDAKFLPAHQSAHQYKDSKGSSKKIRKLVQKNHLLENKKGDVGMEKSFSKKYRNKG